MDSVEILLIVLIAGVLLAGPLLALIFSIIALSRSRRIVELTRRVAELEARVRTSVPAPTLTEEVPSDTEGDIIAAELVSDGTRAAGMEHIVPTGAPAASSGPTSAEPIGWETFIGQRAFGWLAVVLFVFASAFFLRYAYQNNWIGPVGRVAIGELVGAALVVAGWRYHRQGWRRFATMLSAAGIVVLYLATYSAFGFYRLLPQQHAGVFLAILVVESMIAAVVYRNAVLALVAVVGGLLTPVLMVSDRDTYSALFTYLAVLNAGVVIALLLRSWPAVGTVAYLGTQGLFWSWYEDNYHPEKLAWTLGFQGVVFGLYLAHTVIDVVIRRRNAQWEDLARLVLNAITGFATYYVLTRDDYRIWLGSAALAMATVYAIVGRIIMAWRPTDNRLLLTTLATAVGFIAWSLPIQADARWVALGWAAMGLALWWFGLRIAAPTLRLMAGVLATLAVGRYFFFDMPVYTRDPFIPIFNGIALPSIGVAVCLLTGVIAADRFLARLKQIERVMVGVAGVAGVALLWLVLSCECYGYFDSRSVGTTEVQLWRWRGQLALTVLWTVFAVVLLVLGFRLQRARLRWLAIALFVVTTIKLFLVDMANVQQLYRILAFFVLAVVLGLVARAYQRFKSSTL